MAIYVLSCEYALSDDLHGRLCPSYVAVRAGALMRETTDKHGQRPCEPPNSMSTWAMAWMSGQDGGVSAGRRYVQHCMEALRRDGTVRAWFQAPGNAGEWRTAMRRACRAAGLRVRTGVSGGGGVRGSTT
jgi:hypothetical protein